MRLLAVVCVLHLYDIWEEAVLAIEIGNILEGTVSGITPFGAFVELPEGKVGLVHISEVAEEYVSDVKDFLKEHDKVKVKVLTVDEKGKIGLSIKRAQENKSADAQKQGNAKGIAARGKQFGGESGQINLRRGSGFKLGGQDFRGRGAGGRFAPGSASFEDKISKFMKDSEEILRDSSRRTDSKRGGRGGRRRDRKSVV